MTGSETHIADANRLLHAFEQQARIYEQLLAKSEAPDLDAQAIAADSAKAQGQARQIQDSVSDVLEVWGEISSSLDPELRLQVDEERKRLQETVLALLSRHEALLEGLDQQQPGNNDEASQMRLLAE